jgi:retinol dehydrogenase-12
VTFIQCDLASLESVQKAAKEFVAKEKRLDLLYANAGIMATPPGQTKEGYEIQFGTNHVGHALLIKLLLPTLLKTAEEPNSDVRIIILSSAAHAWPAKNGVSFPELKSLMTNTTTWGRYGQSKLANLMYASQLAKHYPSIKTVSIHPGVVSTNLMGPTVANSVLMKWANNIVSPLFMVKTLQGTWNQLWAGTVKKEELISGEYYHPVGALGGRSTISKDEKLQEELWEWTQKELENYNL